ncbi:hypothetical protein [uncultured Dokdonia sp.]|uniref:hypothetical protein n=1 Tax=uncultured Dokdonia sp. TaxID=575653 RepID=UPI0026224295|nr:hypothetical protein [uncultured Dokdonia sp.]
MVPIFMFFLLFIAGVIGIIYTVKNNGKLSEIVSKEKLIAHYRNLKIGDSETFKTNSWKGHIKIYENILIVENDTYFHHIVLNTKKLKVKKQPMTIYLEQITIKDDTLVLQGIKHRVFGNSHITIRIKSNTKNELMAINESIHSCFAKNA